MIFSNQSDKPSSRSITLSPGLLEPRIETTLTHRLNPYLLDAYFFSISSILSIPLFSVGVTGWSHPGLA